MSSHLSSQNQSAYKAEAAHLIEEGNEQLLKNCNTEARQAFEKAVTIYQNIDDKEGIVDTLIQIGKIYYRHTKLSEVQEFFNRAIATYQAVADKIGEADTLIKIAGVYFRDVRYYRSIDAGDSLQIALDYYQKALAIYRDVEDKHGVGLALNNLGLVYFCLEKNDKALHPLQEALSLSREIKFLTVEGSSLHNIGWIKENLGRAKDIGSDEQPFYENLDLVEQALASYQQALDIHRQINDKAGISDTLRNIGATYENRQQFNEARTCYQQAITGYKELGDRTSISDIISKTKIPNLLNRDDPFFPPLQASMSGRTDDGGSPKIIESKKKP
ncbi:MAG: tetratricopeptide repeat protein [Nostoc sp.]|uniref:tetratricopeptide repeat protein n=1 Tax=Nostoc sp. TaxID=1180 RepID=UPI002FFC2132